MSNIPVVDSHVHLWDPNQLSYAWHKDVPALSRKFLVEEFTAAHGEVNVERVVFVQCDVDREYSLDEVAMVTKLAADDPRIQGIVAFAPLENGDSAKADLETLRKNGLVKGVRRLIQSEEDGFCVQPNFVKGVQSLEEFGFSFDICIYHSQLADSIKLVKQCPNVSFVLDHIGKPDIKSQKMDPWKSELKELASMANVHCKLSGLITEADHDAWKPEDLEPFLAHAIDCFGFDRLMFGGDWPVSTLAGTWLEWHAALSSHLANNSAAERKKVLHDNAIAFYRL